MMARFDFATTTMQVRKPLLERIENGEQLLFMHRINFLGAGEFKRGKATEWSPFALSCPKTAPDVNVTRIAR
jgi:hypothetical protein